MLDKKSQEVVFPFGYLDRWWSGVVTLAVATGIAYFLAGQLGLALRHEPGMAVFWPAAGIAVGALTALGPQTRLPVAASVFFASAACSLMIGRNAWLSISFAFLNTGQALLTAWLLEHWFGRPFKLEDVQRVLGLQRLRLDVLSLRSAPRLSSALSNQQHPPFMCGGFGSRRAHWGLSRSRHC